jgi:hypothetical protein
MLTNDLTVVDSHAGLTLPGLLGSKVYAQITGPTGQQIVRRIAATAATTQQTLTIGHTISGTGFNARIRTLVRHDYKKLDADVSTTGGVMPVSACYFVQDRPIQSGGAITDAILTNNMAALVDVLLTSGQFAKLLNQEA